MSDVKKKPTAEPKTAAGFGSGNLTDLEQKGAYSGTQVDHFVFEGDHPANELLPKTADKAE